MFSIFLRAILCYGKLEAGRAVWSTARKRTQERTCFFYFASTLLKRCKKSFYPGGM